jgi:leucyl aminopeptidase
VSEVLRKGDLEGGLGKTLLLHNLPGVPADRVLLVGLGREREFGEAAYRTAMGRHRQGAQGHGRLGRDPLPHRRPVKRRDTDWKVEHAVLAMMEGAYRFDRLKSKPPENNKRSLRKVVLHVPRRSEIAAGEQLRRAPPRSPRASRSPRTWATFPATTARPPTSPSRRSRWASARA